jgi:glutaminyl-tRNA synthetase
LVFNRIITLKDTWTAQTTSSDAPSTSKKPPTASLEAKRASPSLTPEEQSTLETLKSRGLNDAEALILARDADLRAYLERTGDIAATSSFVIQFGLREDSSVAPDQLAGLMALVSNGSLSRNMAKTVVERALESGESPLEIVEREGLQQVSDTGALEPVVAEVIAANPDKLEAYRGGRTGLLGFFVGEVMKRTKGAGNPQLVQTLVKAKLEG